MKLSTHIYLFAGFFIAIFCTQILPMDDKKPTESSKINFIITYTQDQKQYLVKVQEGLKKKYGEINDPTIYKTFDEVFEIKDLPVEEITELKKLDKDSPNTICYF